MKNASQQQEIIKSYIERSITDIARKCNVCNIVVIETIKKLFI